jgi:hypothetical protein
MIFLIQQIFLYTTALYAARRDEKLKALLGQSVSMVASQIEFSGDIPDQRVFISSPGNIFSYAKNLVPLIAGALITMSATVGPDAFGANIKVVNSVDSSEISQVCQADISAEVMEDMNAMGYARWQELCIIEMRARQRTQFDSGMTLTKPDRKSSDFPTGSIPLPRPRP